jgi:5-methylcytosine-specific restriction endonuclease McrA
MGTFSGIAVRRTNNTTRNGGAFDEGTINAVWNRAKIVSGIDPNFRRKDACGAWIQRSLYGNTAQTGMGWEIDHIMPVSRGGLDSLANLQPLQWQNNRAKGDKFPVLPAHYSAVIAQSN